MATVKGMYRRGALWWLRYTPARNAPQKRVSLETEIEEVAAVKALDILHRAPLEDSEEWAREVEAYIADRVGTRKMSKNTVKSRRYCLLRFAKEIGVSRLEDLSVSAVERWMRMLKEGDRGEITTPIKENTMEVYYASVRAFLKWLAKRNKIVENFAAKVELARHEKVTRKDFVLAEKVQQLIDNAPDDDARFILYCGFHAGMRKMEIVEARRLWFRLGTEGKRGCIAIHKTETYSPKNHRERILPLSKAFEVFLRKYLARLKSDDDFVLKPEKKKHGKHIYRVEFWQSFRNYTRRQEVRCTLHDMRRTFVSLKLIEDSSLIFKVARWAGDRVNTIEDHYAHLLADDPDIEKGLG